MIIDLRQPDLRKVEVGTGVITSKGFTFWLQKREGDQEWWLDDTSGLVWGPVEKESMNYYEAMETFNTPEKRLPTKEEFKTAETHGFREVLPDMNHWFWSSSVHPDYSDYAYDFNGRYGYIDYYFRDRVNFVDAVRTVSER